MSFHSTLSRREFMKGLGFAGAGLGAAAVAAPVFHDLDEMTSSAPNVHGWPWWVKEMEYDSTTVEIEWPKVTRWDARHILQCGWQGAGEGFAWLDLRDGAGAADKVNAANAKRISDGLNSGDPFYDIRANALTGVLFSPGLGFMSESPNGFIGPSVSAPSFSINMPTQGTMKWTGTPEEASIMLNQAMVLLGASDIGIIELNPSTSRNMIYKNDFYDGKPYTFEDVDKAYETGPIMPDNTKPAPSGKRVIPNKCKYLVHFSFDESSQWLGRKGYEGGLRYPEGRQVQLRTQAFIKGLGYQALGPMMYTNNLSENVGMAVLSGQAELGRNNLAVSPKFGAVCGQCSSIITDLPLAPTKPINAGIRDFCVTCMKCAEYCPGGALSRQGKGPSGPIVQEPTWESVGPWQRWPQRTAFEAQTPKVFRQEPGVNEPVFYKHWWYSWPDCLPNYDICGTWGCGVACPFKDGADASVHELVMSTVSTTSVFNSFFRKLDDTFGYNAFRLKEPDAIEAFWKGDAPLPRFGTETSMRWRK